MKRNKPPVTEGHGRNLGHTEVKEAGLKRLLCPTTGPSGRNKTRQIPKSQWVARGWAVQRKGWTGVARRRKL